MLPLLLFKLPGIPIQAHKAFYDEYPVGLISPQSLHYSKVCILRGSIIAFTSKSRNDNLLIYLMMY